MRTKTRTIVAALLAASAVGMLLCVAVIGRRHDFTSNDSSHTSLRVLKDRHGDTASMGGAAGAQIGRTLEEIRFNKVNPIFGGSGASILPLLPNDYPIGSNQIVAMKLRQQTMADSVFVEGDYQLFGATASTYLNKVANHGPHYPSRNPNAPFWDELRHVIEVQQARRGGIDADTLNRWPSIWNGMDLNDIAKAVQNEYPVSLQQQLIEKLFRNGVGKVAREALRIVLFPPRVTQATFPFFWLQNWIMTWCHSGVLSTLSELKYALQV